MIDIEGTGGWPLNYENKYNFFFKYESIIESEIGSHNTNRCMPSDAGITTQKDSKSFSKEICINIKKKLAKCYDRIFLINLLSKYLIDFM